MVLFRYSVPFCEVYGMKKLLFLLLIFSLFFSCQNTGSSSSNSDFEGFWSCDGVVLHFSAASLIWMEASKENHTYTYSAGSGSITITDKTGKTISGTYSLESNSTVLRIKFTDRDELYLVKISEDV